MDSPDDNRPPTPGSPGEPTTAPPVARDTHKLLVLLLFVVTLAFATILTPFLSPILWGLIIALVFAPAFRHALRWTDQRRTLAALLTLAGVVLLVVLPLTLLALALTREAVGVFERLQSGEWNPAAYLHRLFDALPAWVGALLDRFGLTSFNAIQRRVNASVSQGVQSVALVAVDVGQDMFNFIAKLFITLYLAFFMIRDGNDIAHTLRDALPLHMVHKRELFRIFATVLRATVKGHLMVAMVQGALGGLAFWALGIDASLLWAVLMALLALLPVVGSGLVWLPMALFLIANGALWQGLALMAYGLLVIGLIDNLLRPMLVGKDTRLPDYLVMVATLGGLVTFGINGLVLGPAIAALFVAVWKIDMTLRERP
ncbi:AI-2E family transporter [Hydrogenophaga sp. OTU3427]|uniref:AI-2E family transporter n=1 Tax=Hydrogenophaga sp. OTU3427 TaxID=3043856 RepID=UPI00313EFC4D